MVGWSSDLGGWFPGSVSWMGPWGFVGIQWVCWGTNPSHWTVVYSSGHKTKSQFPSFYKVLPRCKTENRLSNYFFSETRIHTLVSNTMHLLTVSKYLRSSWGKAGTIITICQLGKLRFREVVMMWIVRGHTDSVRGAAGTRTQASCPLFHAFCPTPKWTQCYHAQSHQSL